MVDARSIAESIDRLDLFDVNGRFRVLCQLHKFKPNNELEYKFKVTAIRHLLHYTHSHKYNAVCNISMVLGRSPAEFVVDLLQLNIGGNDLKYNYQYFDPKTLNINSLTSDQVYKIIKHGLMDYFSFDQQMVIYSRHRSAFDHLVLTNFAMHLNNLYPSIILYTLVSKFSHLQKRLLTINRERLAMINYCESMVFITDRLQVIADWSQSLGEVEDGPSINPTQTDRIP